MRFAENFRLLSSKKDTWLSIRGLVILSLVVFGFYELIFAFDCTKTKILFKLN